MEDVRPHARSVTGTPCTCSVLERSSAHPHHPVEFDRELNEYHLYYEIDGHRGTVMVYHCFICGGVASTSKRHQLFETVDKAELERLMKLTSGLTSLDESVQRWGVADLTSKTLVFRGLSTVAEVQITQHGNGPVGVSIGAKRKGGAARDGEVAAIPPGL